METMTSLEKVEQTLKEYQGVMLYFSGPNCNVCKVLKPKIVRLVEDNYPDMELCFIDIEETPRISAHYSVFTIPTVVVFLEGREFIRKSRSFSPAELMEEIRRPWDIMIS